MEKNKERMLELLADQTLFGLTEGETAELENLKNRLPEFKDDDSFEMTAAAINLVNLQIEILLPAHLQTKLEARAQEFFAASQTARQFSSAEKNQVADSFDEESAVIIHEVPSKSSIWNWKWLGLGAAVTACIALAIGLWLNGSQPQLEIAETSKTVQTPEVQVTPQTVKTPENIQTPEIIQIPESVKTPESAKSPEPVKTPESTRIPRTVITPEIVKTPQPGKTPAPELTAAQKREQLIALASDVIQTNWTASKGDKRVLGDVVWSNAQQKGYVRLHDLPALDPKKETYQLWIVDEAQNKKTPISGGIFSVSQTGEIIVPINAQSRIQKPKQFAVTKEKAGGVVVSKPDRIVAVARI